MRQEGKGTDQRILVVRCIPELIPKASQDQPTLFDRHRFYAFIAAAFRNAAAADKFYRKLARMDQIDADLKESAPARLPSENFASDSA